MKDPTDRHYEDDYGDCFQDGEDWPCKVWRRWVGSKDYRLAELERRCESLTSSAGVVREQISKLREQSSRHETTLKGIWPVISDLLSGDVGGSLKVTNTVEHLDVHDYSGAVVGMVNGMRDYTVEYDSPTGGTFINGRLVSMEFRKP